MAGDRLTYNYSAFVLAPYGDRWRNLRRLAVSEIFSPKSLRKSSTIREEEVSCVLRRLSKVSASGTQSVELRLLFSTLVSNVVMRVCAGKRYVEEEHAGTTMERRLIQEFKDKFFPSLAMNICDFIPILRVIGFKGLEKNMRKLHGIRDEFLQNLIDEIRLKLKKITSLKTDELADGEERRSVAGTFLHLQESEPGFYTDEVIKMFDSAKPLRMVINISTLLLSFDSYSAYVSKNVLSPKGMVKAEIDEHVGHGRLLNESDTVKLPYLGCVITETLRLYPPAPLLLPHFSSEACTAGGFDIPQGTMLVVNAWTMHRDPKLWEEPDEFKPERFLGGSGEREGFKYIPFGTGRRVCPGAGMGLQIVSLALGALIQCFEWDTIGPVEDMSPGCGITLHKAKPLEASCSPRRDLITLLSHL
ncbi:CYTOCHROME P450 82C3-RELATED [Salix purpurea]|uniref:CYTOCHROME P450 82C3-RELATED n=1 Tax=Salix purpurea TaxID=77065 RepID=A0A9Q0P038_SALPP|nr:CYTOCHROME P450 82C3-RELATED [Salix purpurea]